MIEVTKTNTLILQWKSTFTLTIMNQLALRHNKSRISSVRCISVYRLNKEICFPEACWEPCQTSKMERFSKLVDGYFHKSLHLICVRSWIKSGFAINHALCRLLGMVRLSNKSTKFYSKSKQSDSPFISSWKYGKQKLY